MKTGLELLNVKEPKLNSKDPNKNFEEAINYCKQLVNYRKNLKYKIAEISLAVCDNTHGGRVESNRLSTTRFAEGIGVGRKTLYRWRKEYQVIILKLDKKRLDSVDNVPRSVIEKIMQNSKKEYTNKEVRKIFDDHVDNKEINYIHGVRKRVSNSAFAICHSLALTELPKEDFDFLYTHIENMHKAMVAAKAGVSIKDQNFLAVQGKIQTAINDLYQ